MFIRMHPHPAVVSLPVPQAWCVVNKGKLLLPTFSEQTCRYCFRTVSYEPIGPMLQPEEQQRGDRGQHKLLNNCLLFALNKNPAPIEEAAHAGLRHKPVAVPLQRVKGSQKQKADVCFPPPDVQPTTFQLPCGFCLPASAGGVCVLIHQSDPDVRDQMASFKYQGTQPTSPPLPSSSLSTQTVALAGTSNVL